MYWYRVVSGCIGIGWYKGYQGVLSIGDMIFSCYLLMTK